MTSFASEPMPEPIRLTNQEKEARKYEIGTRITFFINTSQYDKPFLVTARVVDEVDNNKNLFVCICSMGNDFCKNPQKESNMYIKVPKKDVVHVFMCIPNGQCSVEAAGGAKKKSRRRKASKPKRKSMRLKRTSKRRA
jgi:hypothetical protein